MLGTPVADRVTVRAARRLRGELRLPGDKSISHRALLLALLAAGESRITGAGDGRDVRATADVASALGASVTRLGGDARSVDYRVVSPGRAALVEPAGVLDCRNSGTTFRLVADRLVAGQPEVTPQPTCRAHGHMVRDGRADHGRPQPFEPAAEIAPPRGAWSGAACACTGRTAATSAANWSSVTDWSPSESASSGRG